MNPFFRVTCAIIIRGEKILTVQRNVDMDPPLMWEFPGGKIHPGESDEDCVIREIKEELHLTVFPVKKIDSIVYHYPEKSIELIPFICTTNDDSSPILKEHLDFKWLLYNELLTVNWADADIPIAEYIQDNFPSILNELSSVR